MIRFRIYKRKIFSVARYPVAHYQKSGNNHLTFYIRTRQIFCRIKTRMLHSMIDQFPPQCDPLFFLGVMYTVVVFRISLQLVFGIKIHTSVMQSYNNGRFLGKSKVLQYYTACKIMRRPLDLGNIFHIKPAFFEFFRVTFYIVRDLALKCRSDFAYIMQHCDQAAIIAGFIGIISIK